MSDEHLNIRLLVEKLGGPAEVTRRLNKAGYPITLGGVEQWIRRKQLSTTRLIQLATTFNRTADELLEVARLPDRMSPRQLGQRRRLEREARKKDAAYDELDFLQ